MFKLKKEDWTHLGGPMGTEYTTTIWDKYFTTSAKAMKFAEKDHGKQDPPIAWVRKKDDVLFSGDLASHAYYVSKVVVEK